MDGVDKIGIELPSDWNCGDFYGSNDETCCSDEWCFENTSTFYGTGNPSPTMPAAVRIKKGTAIEDVEDERLYDLYYDFDGKVHCDIVSDTDYCKMIGM